jgi:transmembrane sensor
MNGKEQNILWELAIAKLHGEASEKELQELEKLLKDEKNKTTFSEIEQLYSNSSEVKNLSGVSMESSWNTISNKVKTRPIQWYWNFTKYAAIIVFAFLLGSIITNQFNNEPEITTYAEVKVPLGQMSEITLYDGTKVWLNSGTTLRYSNKFGNDERNVSLDGEAFFEVTKNKTPFKVKLKNSEVEVLGTTFNAVSYTDENYSQVTLVEGKVNLNNLNGSVIAELKPSEQINIDDISKKATIGKVETNFYTSWTEGKIVFDDEKLSDIARKLERWYNVDIQFKDESINNLRFSGTILKHKPFNQILAAFELLLPVSIKYTTIPNEKDLIVISKK